MSDELDAVARLRDQLAAEIAEGERRLADLRRRYQAAAELLTVASPSATVDKMDLATRVQISKSLAAPVGGLKKELQDRGYGVNRAAEEIGVDKSLLSRVLSGAPGRKLNPLAQAKLDRILKLPKLK